MSDQLNKDKQVLLKDKLGLYHPQGDSNREFWKNRLLAGLETNN